MRPDQKELRMGELSVCRIGDWVDCWNRWNLPELQLLSLEVKRAGLFADDISALFLIAVRAKSLLRYSCCC